MQMKQSGNKKYMPIFAEVIQIKIIGEARSFYLVLEPVAVAFKGKAYLIFSYELCPDSSNTL